MDKDLPPFVHVRQMEQAKRELLTYIDRLESVVGRCHVADLLSASEIQRAKQRLKEVTQRLEGNE
jgi:hypothetical protein